MSENSESLASVELVSARHILGCSLIVVSKGKTYKQHFFFNLEIYAVVLFEYYAE